MKHIMVAMNRCMSDWVLPVSNRIAVTQCLPRNILALTWMTVWRHSKWMNGISYELHCASHGDNTDRFSLNIPLMSFIVCFCLVSLPSSFCDLHSSMLNCEPYLPVTPITHLCSFCSFAFKIQLFPPLFFLREHFDRAFASAVSSYSFGSLP